MTIFDHRRREEEGPPSPVYPGPSIISGGPATTIFAPLASSYVTTEPEAGLPNERVLAAGEHVSFATQGPGGFLTITANAIGTPDSLGFPGQSTALASEVLLADAPEGIYMVVVSATVSVGAAAGTMSAEAQYVNNGAQSAEAFSLFDLTAPGTTAGMATFQHDDTGGDITVTTTFTGDIGAPIYEVHFRLIRLG